MISDPSPPTLAEINVAAMCRCPHAGTHGHLGGCQYDTNPHYCQPKPVYAKGGPVNGGMTVWLNEYSALRTAAADRRVIVPGVTAQEAGERLKAALGGCPHENAEPVELCTGEVVAAVCPTCLVALSPSWVGSDWRP